MKKVKVYLVGAGPGRPDLITVRGLNILKEADVIVYDYLVDRQLLEHAKERAQLVCCDKLAKKGKHSNGFLIDQGKIAGLVIKKAEQGQKVVRLKNGDPSIFGRYCQELEALAKAGIGWEVVPGVTAANAASCLSGIPLTDRRYASSCVFVTGHEDPAKKKSLIDWKAITKSGTIVLYMSVENLADIVSRILEVGKNKDTPVAIIQDASLPTERVLTGALKDIVTKARNEKIKPPAVVIVGDVVKLEKKPDWIGKNKRILFTGLSNERFFINDTYIHLPLIKIQPLEDYSEFDDCLKNIRKFDWIVFVSRYGVEYFFKRFQVLKYDARALSNIKIAAIGSSTKSRLLNSGIVADMIPMKESSEGLIKDFKKIGLRDKKIFLPRSDISDKGLSGELKKLGAIVTASFAYRNVIPENLPDLDLGYFDEIMFTSPSTVRNFKKRYRKVPKNVRVRCIGALTLKEAKRCKLLD